MRQALPGPWLLSGMAMAVVLTDASRRGGTRDPYMYTCAAAQLSRPLSRCLAASPRLAHRLEWIPSGKSGGKKSPAHQLLFSMRRGVAAVAKTQTHRAERRQLGRRPAQDWRATRLPRGPPCDLRAGPSCQRMRAPGTRAEPPRRAAAPAACNVAATTGGGRARRPGDRERRATPQPPLPTPFTQVSESLSRHRAGAATRSRYVSRGSAGSPPHPPPPPTMDDGMPTTTHARPYGTCPTTVATARGGLPQAPSRTGRASTRPHGDSPPPRRESATPLAPAHLTSGFSAPTLRGGAGRGGRGRMAPICFVFAGLGIAG